MSIWISPTGGSGTDWNDIGNAYDDNESSKAASSANIGWTYWVELTVPPLLCDKIRFKAYFGSPSVQAGVVEVYYEGAYHSVYTGDYLNRTWVEKDLIPGSPGQAKTVSKIRFMFLCGEFTVAELYEVDFNQVQSVIPNMMKHYRNMRVG